MSNAKNRHGNVYCYFMCSGRHSKRTDCTRQAMLIEDTEKVIEDYYTRVQITPAQQEALAGMLHHEFDRLMAAETEELERLTTNRDRLEIEQDQLMQAHYADAIPLSVLKREQDRIVAKLDQVTRRLDAHFGDYADARAHLDDALGLLANWADIYIRCDDTNRRLCNQAFFTKVFIDEDNKLRVEHNRPFEMLLDPQVNANALTWATDVNKARTSTNVSVGKGSSLERRVALSSVDTNKWTPLLTRDWEPAQSDQPATDYELRGPLRQRQNRLTPGQVAAMAERYLEGATVRQLAIEFRCHRVTVAHRLKDHGVEMRNRPATAGEVAQFVALYESGLSLATISEKTGFSQKTVMNRLRAEGIKLRDTHGHHR